MAYRAVGLDESAEAKLDLILRNQEREAQKRKFTLIIGATGALIAAAKLGIVAIPLIKAARRRPG